MNKLIEVLNKKKGFSLIEILITLVIMGILAAGFVPVLTKRAKRSTDPDCPGGYKTVRKVFYESQSNFVIPDGISSGINFILIGGGSGGENGRRDEGNTIEQESDCNLYFSDLAEGEFYSNVVFSAVQPGESAECGGPMSAPGLAGGYISNRSIDIKKSSEESDEAFICEFGSDTYVVNGESDDFNWSYDDTPPIVGGSGGYQSTLPGGKPNVSIIINGSQAGVGESCVWYEYSKSYVGQNNNTEGACKLSYNVATSGSGGASGASAKFSVALSQGSRCNITVGAGGESREIGDDQNNTNSTVQCDGGTVYSTGNRASLPGDTKYYPSNEAQSSDSDYISGGEGAIRSLKLNDSDNPKKALGGCYGVQSSKGCSNPNGENGALGSGGGGGSCSNGGCGVGGRGGSGAVIIEYKVQCQ